MLCHDLVSDLRTVRAFRQKGKIFISPPPSISHCNWYCLRETNANTFERRKTRKQIESPGLLPRSERSSKELDLVSTSTIIKSFERSTRSILLNERKKKLFEFNFPKKILLANLVDSNKNWRRVSSSSSYLFQRIETYSKNLSSTRNDIGNYLTSIEWRREISSKHFLNILRKYNILEILFRRIY